MNYKTRIIFTALLVIFTAHYASAQRTMSGQSSLRASSLFNGRSVCAEAFYERYTLGGYWDAGVTTNNFALPVGNLSVKVADLTAAGGYMHRLAATRSRSLNLYAGGGILAGAELVDPLKEIPDYISSGAKAVDFIYGIYARLCAEWFWSQRVGMVFHGSVPMVFNSYGSVLRWDVGAGIKIVL